MSQVALPPSRSSFPAYLAVIGAIAVFYFVIDATYLKNRDAAAEPAVERPSLAEHRAKEAQAVSSYQVIDAAQGKVRLPLQRAKDLVVSENSK